VLVQGDISGDESLFDMVKTHIKVARAKPGDVFLGLLHRLDRNVAGIVLFAKTSKGASRLSEQFRDHTIEKIYHAWVEGIPTRKSATLKNFLSHHEGSNTAKVYDNEVRGADYAELSYEVVEEKKGAASVLTTAPVSSFALLKIKLKTGRQHQIRAQLSHMGHPIVGDVKYGASKPLPDQHLALYATELHFNTATPATVGGQIERKSISIPVPKESW
jgi:23S rRNA pseudouridine1911/1915/1917 synthase